ncbi:thiamine biosynthesis protein ThiJ [Arthrobacter sp. MYb224]|uniref:type 1 glutamine amidotransferase domain-containing protein n=1 Tax=Micrococcaceae TaxID=1268 RepID=UPI000CFE2826|nr:type 1 glutamine amidotransferase domain-containing protein [Arthrobacter sp. MYb224]PQZ98776.1 thiamine biosynthesis protein ThiJ [Arthrobacter sp. MYb224]
MKKILMVLTSVSEIGDTGEKTGYNVAEAAHPWKVFKDSGHFVDFASIKGGQPPQDTVDTEDPIQVAFTQNEATRAGLYNTARVQVVDPGQYDGVYLVGGHGTMWDFPENEGLQKLVASVYDAGGLVGAVCHGSAGLLDVELKNGLRLIEGRTVAAFTNEEEVAVGKDKVVPFLLVDRLVEQGAIHEAAENFEEKVVVDERLVTGQNPASAAGVAKEMEKLFAQVIQQEKAAEQHDAEDLRAQHDAKKSASRREHDEHKHH